MRTRSSLLPAFVMVATVAVLFGCETTPASQDGEGASVPDPVVTVAATEMDTMEAPVEVGYDVGLRTPEFAMSLLGGAEVTASSLSAEGKPVFLYFHATY